MSRDRIAAYTYRAEIYCPGCIVRKLSASRFSYPIEAERQLDIIAHGRGIDREDEYSFDSDDFPKVVFGLQIDGAEYCAECELTL